MAKIPDGSFKDWQDTQTVTALEYKREREMLRVATNDNDERLAEMEASLQAVNLGSAQLQKITDDVGGVKINVSATSDSILDKLVAAKKGMHTFYAASGSKDLPPTAISIRGVAHFTDDLYGWVYASDYKGGIFTNYYLAGAWTGWRESFGWNETHISDLNSVVTNGIYYAPAGTTGIPGVEPGNVIVMCVDTFGVRVTQTFIDTDGEISNRTKTNGVWGKWKRSLTADEEQTELWAGSVYLQEGQAVVPSKSISNCRNGWILVWSDYNPGSGAQDYDIHETHISKFSVSKFPSKGRPIGVPNTANGSITKYVYVSDTQITGSAGNEVDPKSDVVLRYVAEW